MAKSSNQKLKPFYIIKILSEHTDEQHPISTQQLIDRLLEYDITAERKSIYSDINELLSFGYDIVYIKARKNGGYYMAGREFELPELKLLVDAVLASRFITLKKSRELIKKIEQLAGKHEAGQLRRQVFVAERIKTENESIYYNVDTIHRAIQENQMISFCYMEWTIQKELKPKHQGAIYQVSPWALTWKDENYYLIAYDDKSLQIRHYRVDKMAKIKQLNVQRAGSLQFKKLDIASYTNKTFGMFGGEEDVVVLKLPYDRIGIILDRFGKHIDIRQQEDGYVTARIKVVVSEPFFGWLTGLGGAVILSAPKEIKEKYVNYLQYIRRECYGDTVCNKNDSI